jgi:hypothetical protein
VALGASGVVVEVPVVALGEHGHTVDVRGLHRGGELPRVELDADVGDRRACVEVEVHLPAGQFERGRR